MKKFGSLLLFSFIFQMSQIPQFAFATDAGDCYSNLGLGAIPNGVTVTGYTTSTPMAGTLCTMSTVTCIDGNLTGPDLYPSCTNSPNFQSR